MSEGQKITHELSISDVISKTFLLYRRDFTKYVLLFAVVEAIIGILTMAAQRIVIIPTLPVNATPQQVLSWLPGFFVALAEFLALTGLVSFVLYPVSYGSSVKIASQEIENGRANLAVSVRFTLSKLVWLWAIGLVAGIFTILGFIALIFPGIILAIMFSLVLPIIIIEGSGFKSLERSRQLVGHRWLKTLGVFIFIGGIILIASLITDAVSAPFGIARTIVSSILSSLYLPLSPIALTVYYYSNAARIEPIQSSPPVMPQPPTDLTGMKFCTNCGTQLASAAVFCPNCGTKQSV